MGSRDAVISRDSEGNKIKLKKYYLTLYLREAYAIFLDENPNEILSFSKFCELRPENVLLMRQTPLNQCLCQSHENFRLLLFVLDITYTHEFWLPVLCNTEPNSSCWLGTCADCRDGKKFSSSKPMEQVVNRQVWKRSW